ncbi:MAG: methyltransferase domain-containing protein [Anaerolineales bacterium]
MTASVQLTPKAIYEMVAELGFRKYFHFGGFKATQQLIELLPLDRTKTVLEVGCASGKSACYIARTFGCRVVGVDLLPGMIERARERGRREGVEGRVEFRVGDAQALPFEDDTFDIVMGEFIIGLVTDKQKALSEYRRVAKPGGVIGLNEATWIRTPPPQGLAEYLTNTVGLQGEILAREGWQALLAEAGIRDLVVQIHKVETLKNPRDDCFAQGSEYVPEESHVPKVYRDVLIAPRELARILWVWLVCGKGRMSVANKFLVLLLNS